MKKGLYAAIMLCFLWLPLSASAIDPTDTVKVTTLMRTSTSWNGEPLVYPQGSAEVTGMLVELAPGGETGWHLHNIPSFAYMLEGVLEVCLKDGRTKRLKAGDALAEVVGTWHNGRNIGNKPVRIVVFYTGVAGGLISAKEPVNDSGKGKNKK